MILYKKYASCAVYIDDDKRNEEFAIRVLENKIEIWTTIYFEGGKFFWERFGYTEYSALNIYKIFKLVRLIK